MGQRVYSSAIEKGEGIYSEAIELKDITPGIYIIKIIGESGQSANRFLIK